MKSSIQLFQVEPRPLVVQKVTNQHFDAILHRHPEYELIYFTQGSGVACIGNYEGKFQAGDIYFIGINLLHAFKITGKKQISAIVVKFHNNCWSSDLINMPDFLPFKEFLEIAGYGIQVTGKTKERLAPLIKSLKSYTGLGRLARLTQCLEQILTRKHYAILSKKKGRGLPFRYGELIDKTIDYILTSFQNKISLLHVATVACMSIPSFCHYFKIRTSKTYIDFLNEVRIDYACRQLQHTNKSVTEICYESGYNTIVHFHRLFLKLKKLTPLQYRKKSSIKNEWESKGKKYKTLRIAS